MKEFKLGDTVDIERGGVRIACEIIHVPTGQEVWFRLKAGVPWRGTFEATINELRPHIDERSFRAAADILRVYPMGGEPCGDDSPQELNCECGANGSPHWGECDGVLRPRVPPPIPGVPVWTADTTIGYPADPPVEDTCKPSRFKVDVPVHVHIENEPEILAKLKDFADQAGAVHKTVSISSGQLDDALRRHTGFPFPVRLLDSYLRQRVVGDAIDPETPGRMHAALGELTEGYGVDLVSMLKTFPLEGDGGLVLVKGIKFASLCEHHVLPFTGTVDVAYIPGTRIVGLSKIPRLVRAVTRRLQVQERIGKQIADAMECALAPKGVMVVVRGRHTCMAIRGVEADGEMVTSYVLGVFGRDAAARSEALSLME